MNIATIDQRRTVRTVNDVIIGPAHRPAAVDEIDYNSRGTLEYAEDKWREL
jgi:hypothetical protein